MDKGSGFRHNVFETIQYLIIKAILLLISLIPKPFVDSFSKVLGLAWLRFDKRHAGIALENIRLAYGGSLTDSDALSLRKRHFVQFARLLFDIPKVFCLNKYNLDSYVVFEGGYNYFKALKEGRGIMLITAHMGNWELMAASTALKFGRPLAVVVRPLDYEPLNMIAKELRESTGNKIIEKYDAAGTIRKLLAQKEIVGILLDQKASGSQAVDVPFFGTPALTNKVSALLAQRYDAVVVPVFNHRMPDGRYRVVFDKPVRLKRSKDSSQDIIENTMRFNQIIEKHVRTAPENWFWTHRRWRH